MGEVAAEKVDLAPALRSGWEAISCPQTNADVQDVQRVRPGVYVTPRRQQDGQHKSQSAERAIAMQVCSGAGLCMRRRPDIRSAGEPQRRGSFRTPSRLTWAGPDVKQRVLQSAPPRFDEEPACTHLGNLER